MQYRQVTGSRLSKKGNAAKERWNTYRKALKLNSNKSMGVCEICCEWCNEILFVILGEKYGRITSLWIF